ncbi:phosphate ABC transporter permease PstA [Erysipelothrix urinaevulpis]|uniref:phosphate ABC transporter permease PstA n=1 Tax=Erysipelothrix urinaevulpis TaxID=2683717 RepID=UPI001357ABB6|nr:phosphate ABC transporter permease PstA [Erysipelothrix urinaevulpis]
MTKERKIKDFIYNAITYIASSFSILILIAIFSFVVVKGKDSLSFDMIRNDYWSQNYLVSFDSKSPHEFPAPDNMSEGHAYSSQYGIEVKDFINHEKQKQVVIVKVEEDSIFNHSVNASAGPDKGKTQRVQAGDQIEKMTLVNDDGSKKNIGMIYKSNAEDVVNALEESQSVESLYYKTPGGGIWGSLVATLMLIAISLLIALPLGMFAAIYLNEISNKGKIARLIEYSIDLLAGVPSIIFGLMGVIVLYPITSLFKIEGLSILLGALTMSVILLPVIIRSIQESLKVVPDGLRMASLSLGATKTQTIFKIILPSALPGILSAVLLAISRVIGESAALIYTMGTFVNDAPQIGQGATSLAVHIWSVMSQEQPNFELASAISIIILAIVLVLNLSVKFFSNRLERKLGH